MYSKCITLFDPEARVGDENEKRLFCQFSRIIHQIMIKNDFSRANTIKF